MFPLSNDTKNGQYMTEWNVKSRETVDTHEDITYMVGHSYVHSEDDFYVSAQTDSTGTVVSYSTLQISSGRGIVDGVFIQSLTDITIDLLEANTQAQLDGLDPLKGSLVVGLRAMYSTESTTAGTLLSYSSDSIYEGVQVVILPEEDFILPEDAPNNQDQVTAHLKLATFNFINGSINTVVNNYPGKIQNISAERIGNIEYLLSDIYITKTNLDPRKLYTFAGKGTSDERLDTWCDSTGSLMVWDADPKPVDGASSDYKEATFGTQSDGKTVFIVPHQNVDGMTNTAGEYQHYDDKLFELPLADYSAGSSGTVDSSYTNHIKAVQEQINNIYRMPAGKQVGYIDVLTTTDDLPPISSNWDIGDYVLVRIDYVLYEQTTDIQSPASMYVVIPGVVSEYTYHSTVENSETVPTDLTGMEIERDVWDNTDGSLTVNTTDPDIYLNYFDITTIEYSGSVGIDYFMIKEITGESTYNCHYFVVSASGANRYSEAVQLTAPIPLATEEVIGGFYNVAETDLDAGYVYRDDTGHLVLLDYSLLRSGVLAYQLGEDYEVTSGLAASEIQTYLDEYVNSRVAFPTSEGLAGDGNAHVINITLNLSEEDEEDDPVINIYNIDSRFNTSIYIHINGSATSTTTINIYDCQKVRIDSSISGTPVINLYRSCLYYDANVIDYLTTIQDMSLWYEKYEETDPDLLVDNMTVTEVDAVVLPEDLDYWNVSAPNDNHYMYALHDLTFGPDGSIVGAGMIVKNETTSNISEGKSIITSTFSLPQGVGLQYPASRLTRQIKITGTFVNAYATTSPQGYMTMETNFSALTDAYSDYSTNDYIEGVISFLTDATLVTSVTGLDLGTQLDCWQTGSYHCFHGWVIG